MYTRSAGETEEQQKKKKGKKKLYSLEICIVN